MAAMTVAAALTAIRSSTNHDADTQVTDAQLTVKLDQEYQRLARELGQFLPSLFEVVYAPVVTATTGLIYTFAAVDERVVRVERLVSGTGSGTLYYTVPPLGRLNQDHYGGYWGGGTFGWQEQQRTIQGLPAASCPATYRITMVASIPASGYTTLALLPAGTEDIAIERCAGWVRQRHDEDPSYHIAAAREIWNEQRRVLVRRYGVHPVGGLVHTRS